MSWQAWQAYNDTRVLHPDEGGLAGWIRRAVEAHPDRPAVQAVDETLTYAELDARAGAVAATLRPLGAGAVVAVEASRRAGSYAALLGVLQAGCGYLPLDPDDPPQRRELILADAEAEAVVGVDGSVALLPRAGRAADRAAYVIYTSGTTGRPKGVRVGERAVLNFVHWVVSQHEVTAGHRLAQAAPLTFDPSVQQVFPAWVTGACVVPVPDAELLDPYALARWLRRERITVLDLVTPHWQQLREVVAREPELGVWPDLRWLIVGGETVHYEQVRHWYDVVSSPALIDNIYGPTEATVNATWLVLDPAVAHGQVPIGRPLPNYRLYVVDEQGALCPPEVAGELVIAGDGLALRYQSVEETAKAFTRLELPDGTAERAYRTGDIARLLPAGTGWTLEFRGRADTQVKIRGYRIELAEIEGAAKICPDVRDAVVLHRVTPAEQLICCYVGDAGPAELRRFLTTSLAAHQLPNLFWRRDSFPLTRNGKLDRAGLLAELPAALSGRAPDGRPPSAGLEELIAEVWQDGLGLGAVGADENFFSVGGTSMLAMKIIGRLRARGVAVEPGDLFGHPTVAGLADRVAQR